MPSEKKAALLARRHAEYFAQKLALSQNLPAIPLDSDSQTKTPLQPTMFTQNKPSATTSQAQSIHCDSVYEIEPELAGMKYPNVNTLPYSPSLLKKVPNCKFCSAKRFEYEPPGFCCSNGCVKLVSRELPAALKNLYFGTNDESNHFVLI
ncbi:hypothetical protein RDI58_019904 [Solanum bulbocastanum]|uniref:Uncharacterized protein n=1 Tax=Solanum bulbocastanum TaxID=147425 RepID=A0AAN8TCJ9_SOLBU